ncbi:MAG: hypothetical protein AVDCRST_MAG42-1682 [uncultured Chthoniobacterales bacterium]|uniref:Uncharacterized protein n=1 Tax=uncultured Chthoniobacterales bacterium TaxID=1836801 RepID=A0A6J4I2P9_9BACT|nr:MAG: hypothetical protein AVDCRST_MAG42-1682 [uncultured Chthoniobacterales bacterium]
MGKIAAARKTLSFILLGFFAACPLGLAQVISLGGAEDVTILGATTVTNAGDTIVYGNLALTPGTSVTGFPPGQIINGAMARRLISTARTTPADFM